MASIVFRPTCSRCKEILESEVINVEEESQLYASNKIVETIHYTISPYKCPYCGEWFDNIITSGSLHFPVSDDELMSHSIL